MFKKFNYEYLATKLTFEHLDAAREACGVPNLPAEKVYGGNTIAFEGDIIEKEGCNYSDTVETRFNYIRFSPAEQWMREFSANAELTQKLRLDKEYDVKNLITLYYDVKRCDTTGEVVSVTIRHKFNEEMFLEALLDGEIPYEIC